MINAVSGGTSYANITAFVSSNGKSLLKSMSSIASGLKVRQPSDGVAAYFTGNVYNARAKEYDSIQRQLLQASSILDVAESSISAVSDDLYNIMSLVKDYFAEGTSEESKRYIANSINEIKYLSSVTIDNTVYDGRNLLKDSSNNPLTDIIIDPYNLDNRYRISFGSELEVDPNAIDLDQGKDAVMESLQEQIDRAAKYMGALSGYRIGINAQINLTQVSAESLSDAANTLLGVDDVDEYISATKKTIQQQAAVSMLAQSNVIRASVLNLINF